MFGFSAFSQTAFSVFYNATITTSITLNATRFDNASVFYSPTVRASNTLIASRFDNVSVFYIATVSQSSAPAQTLNASRFDNVSVFYNANVIGGDLNRYKYPLQGIDNIRPINTKDIRPISTLNIRPLQGVTNQYPLAGIERTYP